MIVTRGLGRAVIVGAVVAGGLGIHNLGGPGPEPTPPPAVTVLFGEAQTAAVRIARAARRDDRDLLELLPAIIGVLNANRHH